MKLTNSRLQQIIQEETDAVLNEVEWWDKLKSKASDIGGKITGKARKAGKAIAPRRPAATSDFAADAARPAGQRGVSGAPGELPTGGLTRSTERPGGPLPKIDTNSPEYQKWAFGDEVQQRIDTHAKEDAIALRKKTMLPHDLPAEEKTYPGGKQIGFGQREQIPWDPDLPTHQRDTDWHKARKKYTLNPNSPLAFARQRLGPDATPADITRDTRLSRLGTRSPTGEPRGIDSPKSDVELSRAATAAEILGYVKDFLPGPAKMVLDADKYHRLATDPRYSPAERVGRIAWKAGKQQIPGYEEIIKPALKGGRVGTGGNIGDAAMAYGFEGLPHGSPGARRHTPGEAKAFALQQTQLAAAQKPAGPSGIPGLTNQQLASRNEFRLELRGRGFEPDAIASAEEAARKHRRGGMSYGEALAQAGLDAVRARQRAKATAVAAGPEPTGKRFDEHKDTISTRLEKLIKEETTAFLKKQF